MSNNNLYQNKNNLFDFYSILFENDFILFLPELFLIVSMFFLLVFGVIYSTSKHKKYAMLLNTISILSVLSLFLCLCLLKNNFVTNAFIFYNILYLDYFTYYLKFFLVCTVIFSIVISLNYNKKIQLNNFEFNILILLSTISMLLLISSLDFISMYLTIEFQSLCFYVMAASKRNSFFSTESGLKYFLLGAFSSGIILFGISIIYGFTGITNFSELSKIFFFSIYRLI